MERLTDEAAGVLAQYDIGPVRQVRPLRGGMFLRPLLVVTTSGRFVLRAHTFRATPEAFRFQAETTRAAAALGVRCPQVVRDRLGRWGQRRGAAFWALHEFIEGRCPPWSEWCRRKAEPGFLRRLGTRVAAVHGALRRISPPGDPSLSPALPPIQFRHLDRTRGHWNQAMQWLAEPSRTPACRSRETLLAARQHIEGAWDALSTAAVRLGVRDMPRQIVHGDLSPVNLVEGHTDDLTLIDWDCTHVGHRMYDALGDILLRPPWDEPDQHHPNLDEVREYVAGYAAAAVPPLTPQEVAAVPAFCLARQLEDLRQRLALLPNLAVERDEEYATLIGVRLTVMERLLPYVTGDARDPLCP